MAERRMFSKTVTQSARFTKMPVEARLLYYELGMAADDDGFVEAFMVLRMTGIDEKYLKVLNEYNYVDTLNEDLVSHIVDWKRNNYIPKDRYKASVYSYLLSDLEPDEEADQFG